MSLHIRIFSFHILPAVALGAAMGATMGVANTLLNGGGLKDALIHAFKGAISDSFPISRLTRSRSPDREPGKAAIHGVSRGILTAIQGGKFSAGFASVFITSAFAVGKGVFKSLGGNAVVARTAVMAMVGGVTSQITGGKFANGAITGAFVHLFNSEYTKIKKYFISNKSEAHNGGKEHVYWGWVHTLSSPYSAVISLNIPHFMELNRKYILLLPHLSSYNLDKQTLYFA